MHKKIKHVLVVLLFGCLLEVLAEARLMPNAALTLVPFLFVNHIISLHPRFEIKAYRKIDLLGTCRALCFPWRVERLRR